MPESKRQGKVLRGLRLQADLTQVRLAKAIAVSQSHISAYEKDLCSISDE